MESREAQIRRQARGIAKDLERGGMVTIGFPLPEHKEIVMEAIELAKKLLGRPIEVREFPVAAIITLQDWERPPRNLVKIFMLNDGMSRIFGNPLL